MSVNCPFPPGSKVNGYLRDSGGDEQDLSVPQQEAELKKAQTQVTNLVQAIAVTGHNDALLGKLKATQANEAELKAALEELATLVRPPRQALAYDDLARLALRLQSQLQAAPLEVQQTILKALIQKIEVDRVDEEVRLKIHYYFFDGGGDIMASNYDVLPLGGILHSWRTWSRECVIKTK